MGKENKIQDIKRLTYGKLRDKTIDIDYAELSTLIFDQELSSCECRKRMYGIKFLLDLLEDKDIESLGGDEIVKKIELKKIELEKERKKIQALRNDLNRTIRVESRFEIFYEELKIAIENNKLTPPIFERKIKEDTSKAYVLNFSDMHYGASFKSENNEYSPNICLERMTRLAKELKDIIDKEGIDKLIVCNLADSIQGILRISDMRVNSIDIVQAVVEVSKVIAFFLNELSKYTQVTYYHISSGNHCELRLLNTKAGEMANEDLEKIIVNYVHDVCCLNERINVPITTNKGYVELEECGYNFIAMHGHQIKNVSNAIRDLSLLKRKFYDFCMLGHFHNSQQLTVGEGISNDMQVLISPSIIGSCPFSDKILKGAKAGANLYVFEEGKGKTITYNIILN